MNIRSLPAVLGTICTFLTLVVAPGSNPVQSQPVFTNPSAPSPAAQRQMLEILWHQLRFLDNATRNATMFNTGADANLFRQVDAVRVAYETLKAVLLPWQLERGANDLAELDAGLAIISEAFPNFREDINRGRNEKVALRTLCQVLRGSFQVWKRQLDQTSDRLRLGR
jgi:hypothetical protein